MSGKDGKSFVGKCLQEENPPLTKEQMKSIKSIVVIVCALAFVGSTSIKASCCDDAKKAGKECSHKCCVEAAKNKKTCEKCNPKTDKKTEEKK